jgi:hypothetical protein
MENKSKPKGKPVKKQIDKVRPVKKVVKRNGGSACLKDLGLVGDVTRAVVAATPLRLRRTGSDPIREVARMAERLTPERTRIGNFRQRYREQCARMLFYGNRPLEQPRMNPGDVAAALRNDPRLIFLSSSRDLEMLRGFEGFPFDIHVLYGAGDLVLFGTREPGADEAP